MVCPGLQWIGPNGFIVFYRLENYIKKTWVKENPRKTVQEQKQAYVKAIEDVKKLMKNDQLISQANAVLDRMEKRGYLDQDPVIQAKVASPRGQYLKVEHPFQHRSDCQILPRFFYGISVNLRKPSPYLVKSSVTNFTWITLFNLSGNECVFYSQRLYI